MQEIKEHPLYDLVYEMVYNPELTIEANHSAAEQWITGEKDYFNGLTPVDLFDSGEDGVKEVIEYIHENIIKCSKECILEAQSWEVWE